MPRLRIRRLELRIQTTGPECGYDLDFFSGLNILRADNSSGKSTCLQAIIYALGLEGMLSASRDIPLPHAMTHLVDIGGTEHKVLRSHVSLEIENGDDAVLTIRRVVVSDDNRVSTSLVETWAGPALTSPGRWPQQDYFVRRSGSAQRELGFQYKLAEFIGWRIPSVTKIDGSEAPLYLEALFPYVYVEQKHGWTGIQARIPGYLGLREPGKRAVEFLLRLGAYDQVLTRQRLLYARASVEAEWKAAAKSLLTTGETAGVMIRGVPDRLYASFDATRVRVLVSDGTDWHEIDSVIDNLDREMQVMQSTPIRSVGTDVNGAEDALNVRQDELTELVGQLSLVAEDAADASRRRDNLDVRIAALEEDLQRHRDLGLLERLGSDSLGEEPDNWTVCPTCHQELPDGLEVTSHAMTVGENVRYIEQQLATFRAMRADTSRVVLALASRERALGQRISDLRRIIKALKETLTDPDASPSPADVRERLRREDRREDLMRLRGALGKLGLQLADLTERYNQIEARARDFRGESLSDSDENKLMSLRDSLREQLESYGFRSLPPRTLDISHETYRPVHEGFDLGFDLSASDMIRLIWAYLVGLLEVSRTNEANHPSLLIFDEPRQQETARLSFAALLRRMASMEADDGPQVIFATSEDEAELVRMLGSAAHHLISLAPGSKIIRPIQS